MDKFPYAMQRWSQLSECPRLLSSSAGAGWRGFEFQEIEVPDSGTFDSVRRSSDIVTIFRTCGPMKVRYGGAGKPFQDFSTNPRFMLTEDICAGAWQGAQRGLHLFVKIEVIERFTHHAFRRNALPKMDGPNPSVEHLLRALHIDVQHRHPSGTLLGETILASLLCQLIAGSADPSPTPERVELSRGKFDRAREWIDANLAKPFSLEDLAQEIGVSLRHLHRAFPAATGLSPYRYILMQRVDRAKEFIRAGQLSLPEIATAVGFCDQAHMANTFRKLLNAPPSQFGNTRK